MFLPVVSSRTPLRLFFVVSLCILDLRLFTALFQTFLCFVRKKSTGCGCVFRCERWCTFCTIVLRLACFSRSLVVTIDLDLGACLAVISMEHWFPWKTYSELWYCFNKETLGMKALKTLQAVCEILWAFVSFWKLSELLWFVSNGIELNLKHFLNAMVVVGKQAWLIILDPSESH